MPCEEIAHDVYRLEAGKGFTRSNVYFVRSGTSWVLVDAASPDCGGPIRQAADSLLGVNVPPSCILLTHDHPDHAGSVLELTRVWDCPVFLHPDELPMAVGDLSTFEKYANPMDRWVVLPLLRLMPRRRSGAIISKSSLKGVAQAFVTAAEVPSLPDWQCIFAPGHTPGEVAFFRPSDRVLITGDSLLTVDLNSVFGYVRWSLRSKKQRVSLPPRYSTWDWKAAKKSAVTLARLEPNIVAPGHGSPMSGDSFKQELRDFARRF